MPTIAMLIILFVDQGSPRDVPHYFKTTTTFATDLDLHSRETAYKNKATVVTASMQKSPNLRQKDQEVYLGRAHRLEPVILSSSFEALQLHPNLRGPIDLTSLSTAPAFQTPSPASITARSGSKPSPSHPAHPPTCHYPVRRSLAGALSLVSAFLTQSYPVLPQFTLRMPCCFPS